jgi:hypothetical protein
MGNQAL